MAKSKKKNLISIQLDIRVKVPRGYKLSRALVEQAVREWAKEGDQPDGFRIRIIDWKHGKGSKAKTPEDAGISQDEARERFRGLLRAGRFYFTVRSGETL